jgi:large subunit ribosomal protein L23
MTIYEVIKKPLVTEKSTRLNEDTKQHRKTSEVYAFAVDANADKPLIKKSIEKLFNVKVAKVRTCILPGKQKRFGSNFGRTKSWKKAFVTLSEGKIQLFEGV